MQLHLPVSLYIEGLGLIIVAAILKKFMPKLLGHAGESNVKRRMEKLDASKYVTLNDIYLPSTNGRTSQIDHVVVSQYGVFVIETKNYSAKIFGKENESKWTVVYGRKKATLRNPFHQNFGHLQAIREVLSAYPDVPLVSMVVFTRSADLQVEVNRGTHLLYTNQVVNAIKKFDEVVMPPEKMTYVVNQLRLAQIVDKGVKRQHVKGIKSNITNDRETVHKGICPKCGGQLVKKNRKYGPFTGCANFPKCRFTHKGA